MVVYIDIDYINDNVIMTIYFIMCNGFVTYFLDTILIYFVICVDINNDRLKCTCCVQMKKEEFMNHGECQNQINGFKETHTIHISQLMNQILFMFHILNAQ